MKKELRKQKLAEIRSQETPYMTGIRIRYRGEKRLFNAYKIPLEYLIYNKYNGRIGSLVKSYEKQRHIINAEDAEGTKLIERFLWESKPARNETTKNSLVRDGQKQWGIVTDDGIIIDGNRRAMLLNEIYRNREHWERKNHNVDEAQYFIAVILPEGAEPREVSRLETIYQMGEDEKLDYNPIEKYLKCQDLRDIHGFGPSDIADMMGEKEGQITEWLEIMVLMEDYLEYLGYEGIYTRLDKREGQFVNLNQYLKRYENGSKMVDWPCAETDIADLKSVCFDYIRARYEGKEFRYIARPSKVESIFCKGEVWRDFLTAHSDKVEPVTEAEVTVEELRAENPDADLTKLLEARDNDWTTGTKDALEGNLQRAKRAVELIKEADQPTKLVIRAIDTLRKINTEAATFYTQEVHDLLKELNSLTWEYRQMIKRERKK
ncbi:MAG: hypothetical protein DRJ03_18585 [Chloroflexi bacterium]|nr:MAG: hypothetical protein DRI81_09525 [Chloroflexota bacterium]RLC82710.1 MAG: hypothetical protein DRJ03_18585 [Chloroflexota bacterium]